MSRGQRQHTDRDRRPRHIDRGTQWNRNGVGISIQAQLFGQGQIDRNVGSGTAREKGRDSTLTQANQDQRIRIGTNDRPHNQRIDYKSNKKHCTNQHEEHAHITQ
ncbi:hypothetical protein D3C72_1581930 [compost metagenome]